MTPLRDAFVGFFAGVGAVFGAATDVDSMVGTAGGVLTITFAATALQREHTHGERVRTMWWHSQGCLLPEALQLFTVSFPALAFLQYLTLPDGVEKHDLVFLEGTELIR
jgi:hypothetical protein